MKRQRGILLRPLAIETRDGETVVIPAGVQIEVVTSEEQYHDCSEADIERAIDLLDEL